MILKAAAASKYHGTGTTISLQPSKIDPQIDPQYKKKPIKETYNIRLSCHGPCTRGFCAQISCGGLRGLGLAQKISDFLWKLKGFRVCYIVYDLGFSFTLYMI